MGADHNAWRDQLARRLSRRGFIWGSIGTAAGTGAAVGTGLWLPVLADDSEGRKTVGVPLPIPHREFPPPAPFGVHFYFPGPVDGSAFPTDPFGTHPEGRDPSTIGNFEGVVGQVDLTFGGTGKDTSTGAIATYTFHTDTRFFHGDFIGSDQQRHQGTLAFI